MLGDKRIKYIFFYRLQNKTASDFSLKDLEAINLQDTIRQPQIADVVSKNHLIKIFKIIFSLINLQFIICLLRLRRKKRWKQNSRRSGDCSKWVSMDGTIILFQSILLRGNVDQWSICFNGCALCERVSEVNIYCEAFNLYSKKKSWCFKVLGLEDKTRICFFLFFFYRFMWFMIKVTFGEHDRCNDSTKPEFRSVFTRIAYELGSANIYTSLCKILQHWKQTASFFMKNLLPLFWRIPSTY